MLSHTIPTSCSSKRDTITINTKNPKEKHLSAVFFFFFFFWGGGGGILIDRFGPGVGHLYYLAVPGVGIFECLLVPVTTNHFPGGEFQLCFTSHFCPGVGNFTAIFWEMSKSRPMPRLPLIGALFSRFGKIKF